VAYRCTHIYLACAYAIGWALVRQHSEIARPFKNQVSASSSIHSDKDTF
jgi:hypothetical protein